MTFVFLCLTSFSLTISRSTMLLQMALYELPFTAPSLFWKKKEKEKEKKTTFLCVPFPAHREHFSGQICVSLQSHCTTLLLAFLITKYVVLFPHQTILWQQLGILQFNLILILSTWRWHQIPQVKGPDPQNCFPFTSDAGLKSRFLPGIWSLPVSWGSLEPTPWVN